jgi:DNA/RNA-binding domain of Phe-tRNA-synthetase-like protein
MPQATNNTDNRGLRDQDLIMIKEVTIDIDHHLKSLTPTLYASALMVDHITVADAHQENLEKQIKHIIEKWKNTTESDLQKNPHIAVYRDLARQLGNNDPKMQPAVEAMLTRGILKQKFTRINSAVDAANIFSVTSLIPIGLFDCQQITGPVRLTLSAGDERFLPIGAKKAVNIQKNTAVLMDDEGVFSIVGHRDSQRTMIQQQQTERVLIFSWGIPPVDPAYLDNVLYALGRKLSTQSQEHDI